MFAIIDRLAYLLHDVGAELLRGQVTNVGEELPDNGVAKPRVGHIQHVPYYIVAIRILCDQRY